MAWDFSTDPEFQKKLDWVDDFCKNEIEPLSYVFPYAVRARHPKVRALVKNLQDQIKAQGLWAIFLDKDLGGPGYGQLKLGLLNEVIGRYPSAPQMFGAGAPDTGNMEMLAAYGTDAQKERWLKPMLNQQLWSAYSMTEPQGGSDPKLFKTHAVRDGDEWVINGEKWFTSAGRAADLLFVMCTNGMFVVPRETPGVQFMAEPRTHNHIKYNNVRVPADHLLGPEGDARTLAQRRLGGGRIHHAMRTLARCKLAFDMMCERALSRESHGHVIAEHQMVQEKIADSYAAIRMLRLFVLETAWKIDNSSTAETRTDIAAVKYTMAKVLREVSFNALHIHGSLGTTDLLPLQAMYAGAPTMGIADGVDEVHKVTVARNVLKAYEPHEGLWPREYIPAKREQARKKFAPLFEKDPELGAVAEGYAKFARSRGASAE
jgi:alkylation response protein AidB-like acyl-CoA dehydrogenase